jgi:hypothetical protein
VLTTSSFLREPPVPVLTSVVQLFESIENHDSAPLNISESDIIYINYLDINLIGFDSNI